MSEPRSVLVHATTIELRGKAALICGPSGSGKSDLALRALMTASRIEGTPIEARLVSDDQTLLTVAAGRLIARPPETIAGKIEVRGLGILNWPFEKQAEVRLAVNLVAPSDVARLPEPATREWLGISVPLIRLAPFEASAPLKLLLALGVGARSSKSS